MSGTITLAADTTAEPQRLVEILSSTEGQRSFWTEDCEISTDRARFGFPSTPVDLHADVSVHPGQLVRMRVTSGFPFWEGSTWEWELRPATRTPNATEVLFRHYGFGDGYAEADLGHTAHTWSSILDRLVGYASTGTPQPFFPAAG